MMQSEEVLSQLKDLAVMLFGEQYEEFEESGTSTVTSWHQGRPIALSVADLEPLGPIVIGSFEIASQITDQEAASRWVADINAKFLVGRFELCEDSVYFVTHLNPPVTPDALRSVLKLTVNQHSLLQDLVGAGIFGIPGGVLELIGE